MSLHGKKVALTGTLTGLSRAEFRRLIAEAGGEYAATIEDGVHLLVVGERPLDSRIQQARRLGIEVVDREGFDLLLTERTSSARPPTDVPLAAESPSDAPQAVELVSERVLRILDVAIRVRPGPGPLTPPRALFDHYTLDTGTLALLRFVARAAVLRQPCLLEGDTATSKTSAIQYLAAQTNHEIVRINLNGQSDTSELVGRYVPNEETGLPVDEMLEHLHLLEDESRQILEAARDQERGLSRIEEQQIIANERISAPPWRFHEGLVPRAMRHGWWVILDEVNLAEPAVLERLNSVLEREPTLVLTEGPGTRFGPKGDVRVHPDFRIFATMNPAEYQGRSVLSPAYKDRWVATWQAQAPGEVEYRQMLERMVYGTQPDVLVDGLRFTGRRDPQAPYADLGRVPGVGGFLSKLAALHAGLVRMATPGDGRGAALGAARRERYVFSRRGLIAVLDALNRPHLVDPLTGQPLQFSAAPERVAAEAIERTYLDRIRDEEDRARVLQLLASLGMQRGNWLHKFT